MIRWRSSKGGAIRQVPAQRTSTCSRNKLSTYSPHEHVLAKVPFRPLPRPFRKPSRGFTERNREVPATIHL